jgi:hypothetical protein
MSPTQIILCGGLVMGSIDILKNIVFLSYQGRPWFYVLHVVASGALGKSAFQGGLPVAVLGLFFHFVIAFTAFTLYYLASRRLPTLAQHPLLWGPLYGIVVFAFMRWVVFPFTAIGWVKTSTPVLVDGILTHIFCVGLPTALIVYESARRNATAANSSL